MQQIIYVSFSKLSGYSILMGDRQCTHKPHLMKTLHHCSIRARMILCNIKSQVAKLENPSLPMVLLKSDIEREFDSVEHPALAHF